MRQTISLLLMLAAAGCTRTTSDRYPSLLPRPIESQGMAEPKRPSPVAAPDPALDREIAAEGAKVDAASREFAGAAQNAEALIAVAAGLPEGSEPWLSAQAALSEVAAARAPLNSALSRLEGMAIERGTAGQPPYPALDAEVARAGQIAADQAARVATLEGALRGN